MLEGEWTHFVPLVCSFSLPAVFLLIFLAHPPSINTTEANSSSIHVPIISHQGLTQELHLSSLIILYYACFHIQVGDLFQRTDSSYRVPAFSPSVAVVSTPLCPLPCFPEPSPRAITSLGDLPISRPALDNVSDAFPGTQELLIPDLQVITRGLAFTACILSSSTYFHSVCSF